MIGIIFTRKNVRKQLFHDGGANVTLSLCVLQISTKYL